MTVQTLPVRPQPTVGCSTIILRDSCVLMSERFREHGLGQLQVPGGSLHYGEEFAACVSRHVTAETGLLVNPQVLPLTFLNSVVPDLHEHYVSLFFIVTNFEGTPVRRCPDKAGEWGWVPISELYRQQLFEITPSMIQMIDSFDRGKYNGNEACPSS